MWGGGYGVDGECSDVRSILARARPGRLTQALFVRGLEAGARWGGVSVETERGGRGEVAGDGVSSGWLSV